MVSNVPRAWNIRWIGNTVPAWTSFNYSMLSVSSAFAFNAWAWAGRWLYSALNAEALDHTSAWNAVSSLWLECWMWALCVIWFITCSTTCHWIWRTRPGSDGCSDSPSRLHGGDERQQVVGVPGVAAAAASSEGSTEALWGPLWRHGMPALLPAGGAAKCRYIERCAAATYSASGPTEQAELRSTGFGRPRRLTACSDSDRRRCWWRPTRWSPRCKKNNGKCRAAATGRAHARLWAQPAAHSGLDATVQWCWTGEGLRLTWWRPVHVWTWKTFLCRL